MIYFDIEDNPITANGSVVFKHDTLPKCVYMDKPGNWISGKINFVVFFQENNRHCQVLRLGRPGVHLGAILRRRRIRVLSDLVR